MRILRSMVFALLVLGFAPAEAFGQLPTPPCTSANCAHTPCISSENCPRGQSCQTDTVGIRQCKIETCTVSSDCSRPGDVCSRRKCIPGPAPKGPPSPGLRQSGEGGVCGPQQLGGGVVKSIGCQHGLQCRNGYCQRPAQ